MFKRFLINFGVDLILDNAFNLLTQKKEDLITYLEDLFIDYLNKFDIKGLTKIGVPLEQAQFLKDKGVMLVRAVIMVLVHLLLFHMQTVKVKLLKLVKV